MTYTITNQCIGCDRCLSVCPTGAVQFDGKRYWIESDLCNHCLSYYNVAQCAAICPTNYGCITVTTQGLTPAKHLTPNDYWERWFSTYNSRIARLRSRQKNSYWERWFDSYSKQLTQLFATHSSPLAEV